jgi:peptide/nickel transport system substrate-binding protein
MNPLSPSYSGTADTWVNIEITEPLYLYDALNNKLIPWLASDQPTWVDDYTLEIKLRTGVFWQDGEAFSSSDVQYTYELGKRGIYASAFSIMDQLWTSGTLVSITTPDDATVLFNLNKSSTLPLRALFYAEFIGYYDTILPKHIFEQAEQEMAAEGKTLLDYTWDSPVGTGPRVVGFSNCSSPTMG